MNLRHVIRRGLWRLGYEAHRFRPAMSALARRKKLLQTYSIATVLDVGANTGQFAKELRGDLGYRGDIFSYEPLAAAYARLAVACRGDPKWRAFNFALGAQSGSTVIHVGANSFSSSMLEMLPKHREVEPDSRYIGQERVEVRTLDATLHDLPRAALAGEILLKIDTQGFEREVLRGADASLARIRTLQVELSLVPLYRDAPSIGEMCELLARKGYALVSLEAGFCNEQTGELLQVDGIFHRAGAESARDSVSSD